MTQIQAQSFFVGRTAHRFRPHRRVPLACNDNSGSGRHCPGCNKEVIAPVSSEYSGARLARHRWLCPACGHDWVTKSHVPS